MRQYHESKLKEIEAERQCQEGEAKDRALIAEQKDAEDGVPQRLLATFPDGIGQFPEGTGQFPKSCSSAVL